ncbi:MAG: OmpA family protein [Polyangiaceae bacterium]
MRKVTLSLVLVASAALLPACEEGPKPPLKTAADAPSGAADGAAKGANSQWMNMQGRSSGADIATPTAGSIQIDQRILKACGDLPTAHFAFDSAAIAGDAASTLGALARCFVSGPLAGAKMNLVGHADPRGGVAYNIALGQQRAGSVATFLSQKGVAEQRMGTVSKGAFEATGMDENGWALDRKVEVFLAD